MLAPSTESRHKLPKIYIFRSKPMSIYHNSGIYLSTGVIYRVISLLSSVQFYLGVETHFEQTVKYNLLRT